MATIMSAELFNNAAKALKLPQYSRHFWSDSKVVLQRITNHNLRLPKFIARRLHMIRQVFSTNDCHEREKINDLADVATRSLSTKHLSARNKFWLDGPHFLYEPLLSLVLRDARHPNASGQKPLLILILFKLQ